MGVIESYLDIYLTNSACVGLHVLGFRPKHSIEVSKGFLFTISLKIFVKVQIPAGNLQSKIVAILRDKSEKNAVLQA